MQKMYYNAHKYIFKSITIPVENITKNMIVNLTERNDNLPPTEILKIKTMAGCS